MFTKRLFDLVMAFIAISVLFPVLLVLVIVIAIKMGWPVFFKQDRPGKNGKIFYMFKFRSMTNEKDENGILLPNEQRLTSFGKWLRSTSLDELPELWNVLKGDMSFVGPRPLRTHYLKYYTENQNKRHMVPPGITGWAQINGRNSLNWDDKLDLDIWYVQNRSFWLDLKIILKTIGSVLKREGITTDQGSFMISFEDYVKNKTNVK